MNSLRKYFIICSTLFVVFAITGYGLAELNEEWALEKLRVLMEQLESLLDENPFVLALNIFFHNALVAFIVLLTFFSLGVTVLLSLFSNGVILGLVVNLFQEEIGLGAIIAAIAPHGIIELPVFLFAMAIAARLAVQFAKSFSPKHSFRGCFSKALKLYFKIVLPLLFLAALLESFITPLIIEVIR